ncbi:YjjG family noncanonical pyrimidine nucleotidase [Mongoliitalea lutea]|uniref:Noncanonical pyrimidine nucleotidase, YjjG family protein n=1 Tax=Mongoliitalea lutea TaxID=849756 RepID=A0A8J3G5B9_9BACT|nr:YjjG family noncanonical pyrimidine nucleotidase [Mongoliitalea lutea]GHB37747.1 noncanonical pyrimidine nucleotidase, YjjG family protein [Mongoliitalea lutea]
MKKYTHILFDLDHTLWDYDRNVQESLSELYEVYQLIESGFASAQDFIQAFYAVNFKLWAMYDVGKIDKKGLRETRFKLIFQHAGLDDVWATPAMEADFMHRTSSKNHLLPYAFEILEYLKPHYGLHIISNGFNESQFKKMEASGLSPYFDLVITSETTGHKKPDPRIFQYALDQLGIRHTDTIMIGDNPNSDILGAIRANVDSVYFDPYEKGIEYNPTYTIRHLKELEGIL